MSDNSRSDREKLKEEYKAHYRKMRETKERLSRARKTQKISEALRNMDKRQLLDSFDDFLFTVKHQVAAAEARLDVALDRLSEKYTPEVQGQEPDEQMKKENAKDTLRQVKMEMGLLYKEIEQQADAINANKTIGPPPAESDENQS